MGRSFYKKYYEGYNTYETVKGKKLKTVRVYDGEYHILKRNDRDWVMKKILFVVLDLLYWAVFIYAASRNVVGNITWHVSMAGAMSLVAGIYMSVGVVNHTISKRYLTEYEFGEFKQQIYAGGIMVGVLIFMTIICYIISIVMGDKQNLMDEIITIVLYVISACFACSIGILESKSKYVKKPAPKVRAMLARKNLKKEAEKNKNKGKESKRPAGPTL